MRRILFIFALLGATFSLQAQLDRSVQPQPGPATEPEIADYKEYTLDNGIQLIVVENHKLPRISISMSLDVDPIVEGDKAGYVYITGDLLREGTTSRDKAQLDEEIDFMGANLSTGPRNAYASGLSKYSDKLMELLSDVVLNPAFSEESFQKLKDQLISGLRSQADDPGAIAGNVYNATLYGLDHAYGEVATESTVNNITLEDCKEYYNTYFRPNIAYIAIVGDIKPKKARKLVEKYFDSWQPAEVPTHPVTVPALPKETRIALVDRAASVQSEIQIGNRIELPRSAADLAAFRIANHILGGGSTARLFMNLREDKAFTYGAYSSFGTDEVVSTFTASAAVRNAVTDSAIAEFLSELNRIRTELVTDEELTAAKNNIIGSFGRSLERPETVANFGLNIKIDGLDENHYNEYTSRIANVTREDVLKAAQKYIKAGNLVITVVGKASEIADKLGKFGKVERFDRHGNPASAMPAVPAGLTAKKVIDNFIAAVGGKEKVDAVRSLSMTMNASIMGQQIVLTQKWMLPDMIYSLQQSPMGQQESVVNGDSGIKKMNGAASPMSEEERLATLESINIFEEATAFEGAEIKLQPYQANVDGVAAYAIDVTEDGATTTRYYNAETGLHIRTSETAETPQGPVVMNVDYSNYTEVNGILIPHTMRMPLGPGMSADFNVSELKINSGVSADDFKL